MGVYIKGMEMPRNCWECEFNKSTLDRMDFCTLTNKQYNWGLSERPSDCPLIEVPPHSDLIDRDKLREKEFIHDGDAYAVVMSRDIRNAATIIPADKDGET